MLEARTHIRRRLIRELRNLRASLFSFIGAFYNAFIDLRASKRIVPSDLRELDEIRQKALKRTDISDHLATLFLESLSLKPRLIVELGVRGGESTFVLERVARLCDSKLISVDIEECSRVSSYKDWHFFQKDDIAFAREFKERCGQLGIEAEIDVLFIDTSHLFEHTLQEIESWFPYLSDRSKVFFHDTNAKDVYYRRDGSIGVVWNKEGDGVIRALETYFDKKFYQDQDFVDFRRGWLIKHFASCSGFTVLERRLP